MVEREIIYSKDAKADIKGFRYDEKEERIIVFIVSHGSMLIDMNRL